MARVDLRNVPAFAAGFRESRTGSLIRKGGVGATGQHLSHELSPPRGFDVKWNVRLHIGKGLLGLRLFPNEGGHVAGGLHRLLRRPRGRS